MCVLLDVYLGLGLGGQRDITIRKPILDPNPLWDDFTPFHCVD